MQRTIRIKLQPTAEQTKALAETARLFTRDFNAVCAYGWANSEKNGVRLHHATYSQCKAETPGLVSDQHIQARVKAAEALRSAFALAKKGRRVSCPHSAGCPPRYNIHTFKVDWASNSARMSTVAGRLSVPFTVSAYFKPMIASKVCTADLIHKKGGWWLHVVVDLPVPKVRKNRQCVGVDLGVNRPAVTSNRQFLGKRQWKNVEASIFRQKRECQKRGTKSAKRKLRQVRNHQARFRRDCDHVLSRQIIESVKPGGTIVLENLTNLRTRIKSRKRQRRRLHSWSFAQLRAFVAYKAESAGCRVVLIDPRHTSQCCSACGHVHRSNRRSQSLFKCRQCGYALNADLHAARNIRAKHLGTFGTSLCARPLSTGLTSLTAQCGEVVASPASRLL
jgi:IS605 OrfB family transposase